MFRYIAIACLLSITGWAEDTVNLHGRADAVLNAAAGLSKLQYEYDQNYKDDDTTIKTHAEFEVMKHDVRSIDLKFTSAYFDEKGQARADLLEEINAQFPTLNVDKDSWLKLTDPSRDGTRVNDTLHFILQALLSDIRSGKSPVALKDEFRTSYLYSPTLWVSPQAKLSELTAEVAVVELFNTTKVLPGENQREIGQDLVAQRIAAEIEKTDDVQQKEKLMAKLLAFRMPGLEGTVKIDRKTGWLLELSLHQDRKTVKGKQIHQEYHLKRCGSAPEKEK